MKAIFENPIRDWYWGEIHEIFEDLSEAGFEVIITYQEIAIIFLKIF